MTDDLGLELEVARRVALGRAKRWGLKGLAVEELLSDAHLATVLLCREWDPARNIPRHVYVGKFCERRMIDLHRQRYGRVRRISEVPLDEEWDAPVVEAEVPEVGWILESITDPRDRYVIERLMAGALHREIAAELEISKTRVAQLIDRVRVGCGARRL